MHREKVEESNYSSLESHLYHSVMNNEEETVKALMSRGVDVNAKVKGPLTSIHIAVVKGHVNIIKQLLLNGAGVNSRYPVAENKYTGSTLLYRAAAKGYETVVSLLLEYNADVKAGNTDKSTALHIAAEKGYLNIVKMLLQRGATVNFTNDEDWNEDVYQDQFFESKILSDELNLDVIDVSSISRYEGVYSPLHLAVKGKHENIINLLFEAGADVDACDSHDDTALSLAVQTQSLAIVENVLNHSPKLSEIDNKLSLSYAVQFQGEQYQMIVQKLLQYGFSYDSDLLDQDEFVDENALENGHYDLIYKVFADFGDDLEESRRWANILLEKAIQAGNEDMCLYLLERVATLDKSFRISSLYGEGLKKLNSKLLNLLIAKGLNVQDDPDILFFAIKKSMHDLIKMLLKNNFNVNMILKDDSVLWRFSHYFHFDKFPLSISAISPLLLAAAMGDQISVELLLKKGADTNFKTDNDLTPLQISVIGGHLEVVDVFLKSGADIESTGSDKKTLLYLAAEFGHESIVKLLLRYGAKVDAEAVDSSSKQLTPFLAAAERGHLNVIEIFIKLATRSNFIGTLDKNLKTALQYFVEKGNEAMVKFLLDHGAKVNMKDEPAGNTVLFDAVYHGHADIVKILLEYGANPRIFDFNDKSTPLYDAVEDDEEEIVKFLLNYGASPNVTRYYEFDSPLIISAGKGNLNMVAMLIKFGADVNYFTPSGETALSHAFKEGHLEVVKLLLLNGAKFSSAKECGQTLVRCAKKGDFDSIEPLLNHCSDVNQADCEGQTALHLLAKCGCISLNDSLTDPKEESKKTSFPRSTEKKCLGIVKTLMKKGINFELENYSGETALYCAAENGHDAVLLLLLKHGANINHGAKNGKTPLIIAAERGNFDTVKALVKRGANVNFADSDGRTALYFAAEYGHIDTVKLLLEEEADVDNAAENGKTPFFISSERGRLECVEEFLKKNVNIHSADKNGLLAIHYAAESGHNEVVKLLLEYCAVINYKSRYDVSLLANCAEKGFPKIVDLLMEFGATFDLTTSTDLVDHLATTLHKWDVNIFTRALEYFSADYKFLNETCLRSIFDVVNKLDTIGHTMTDAEASNYKSIAKTLVRFFIKMKTVNVHNDENLVAVRYCGETVISSFEKKCKTEARKMKHSTVGDSDVLLYDVLKGDLNRLASFARNGCFSQFLRSSDFKSKYPLYRNIIWQQFNKGKIRRHLIDQCVEVCHRSFFIFAPLPANIIESILFYLSNADLRSLKVSGHHSCSGQ